MDALRKVFRPEFINRVDAIIVFHALNREQIASIVDLELAKVASRLTEHEIVLRLTDAAREWLAEQGYDPEMGARPLKRVIQNQIEDKLSDALLSSKFKQGEPILIDAKDDEIVLTKDDAQQEEEKDEQAPVPTS
jgi:ATP-dependent Clp protease ATP-binding subunit ClpC